MTILKKGETKLYKTKKQCRGKIYAYFFLTLYSLCILVPVYIIFITSVKTIPEAAQTKFSWFPLRGFSLAGYQTILRNMDMWRGLWNTAWINLPSLCISVFMSALASYGFAKLEWKGKKPVFSFLLLTMMIPGTVTITASLVMYDAIGWLGTPLPLMVPSMFGSISTIFFMRQYMMGIPNDLLGAARVDGLNEFGIFLKIVFPLSMPVVVMQFVLGLIGRFNDYMGPLIYLSDDAVLYTFQLTLKEWTDIYKVDLPARMAGYTLSMGIMIAIFFVFQDLILKGISITSGLKG